MRHLATRVVRGPLKAALIAFELSGLAVAVTCFSFSIIGPPIFILQDVHGWTGRIVTVFYGLLQVGEMVEIDRVYRNRGKSTHVASTLGEMLHVGTAASADELTRALDRTVAEEGEAVQGVKRAIRKALQPKE